MTSRRKWGVRMWIALWSVKGVATVCGLVFSLRLLDTKQQFILEQEDPVLLDHVYTLSAGTFSLQISIRSDLCMKSFGQLFESVFCLDRHRSNTLSRETLSSPPTKRRALGNSSRRISNFCSPVSSKSSFSTLVLYPWILVIIKTILLKSITWHI